MICPAFWGRTETTSVQSRAIWAAKLGPLSMPKVTASNQQLEFDPWFFKEALTCPTKKVGVILVFPEDLLGLVDSGPTSIWASQEFKSLEGLQSGLRGFSETLQTSANTSIRDGQIWFPQLLTTFQRYLTQAPCKRHLSGGALLQG